jgi:hypothetical protein
MTTVTSLPNQIPDVYDSDVVLVIVAQPTDTILPQGFSRAERIPRF